ncbi:PepA: leucyl aminopeptidase [Desulfococcus multivorans]|nr:PepA: leucyl aminopeptidase [Desulfococcus multivorans]
MVNPKKDPLKTLIIPVCEDTDIHDNRSVGLLVKKAMALEEFNGKIEEEVVFHHPAEVSADRVIFMGAGPKATADTEVFRALTGRAVNRCITRGLDDVLLAVPSAAKCGLDAADLLEAMMEGAFLGNYRFDQYKSEKKQIPLKKIGFWAKAQDVRRFSRLPTRVTAACRGTLQAREWVSVPAVDKRPDAYAESIAALARAEGLDAVIWDEKILAENGFGALLAVGQGSHAAPRLVFLEYRTEGAEKTVCLVGKGVTFDSGGLNLKIGGAMEGMKMDMAGSAAVAATLISVARLKPKLNVVGVLPLVENMPSGKAIRPGDIIHTYSGKTVEVGNTDAEGRLILADAIAYAVEVYKPHILIDMATLTGACVVALGEKIAAVFTEEDALAEAIIASGRRTFERCWRMPMPEDYKELLKSDFADISNMSSSKWGGAITAALFLSAFVKDTQWVHIDIAGPAYAKKSGAYCTPGGTGFGVRLLLDLLEKL